MLSKIKNFFHNLNSLRELRYHSKYLARESNGQSPDVLVDILFSSRWERFFWIKQLPDEILDLTKLVAAIKPKVVVEVGTNMGGTLFLFSKVASQDAHIVSIDLPDGPGGGGYPTFRKPFYTSFVSASQTIDLLRMDSHEENTLDQLKSSLNGREIDFLFLDGDHSYEGIKLDFEMYSPLVKLGGMVAFHDIKPSLPDNWRQVGPFWEELKLSYPFIEFLSEKESWGGIGVITKT